MNKKYYTYPLGLYHLLYLVLILVMLIRLFFKDFDYIYIIGIIIILIAIIYLFKNRYLEFIKINNHGVQKKDKFIQWEKVKITLYYPIGHHVRGYLIIFGDRYFSRNEINDELKKGFYIFARKNRITYILQHYNKHIKLLNEIKNGNSINMIVNKHNDKFLSEET